MIDREKGGVYNGPKDGEEMNGRAWFVRRPRDLEALRALHPLDGERPFRVAAELFLEEMDFQNFITDLLADRGFLERYADLCAYGEAPSCLLVRCEEDRNGILAVPGKDGFLEWAAFTEVEP